jgi:hypothetical protein
MDHHVAYSLGAAFAQLDMPDEALRWLSQARQDGFPCYPWFERDPLLAKLKQRPAFQAFSTTSSKTGILLVRCIPRAASPSPNVPRMTQTRDWRLALAARGESHLSGAGVGEVVLHDQDSFSR